jgi:fusaric acid resistance family protein
VLRVRQRGRSAAFRAARITGATVAAFLAAEALGLRSPPPLIAALTALLVVQATLSSTLTNGVQRVLSVVAGVALAMLFVTVVGLTWWSLAALVAAAIVVGQMLRLGPHLVEVPISAMLVLGVGYSAGTQSTGYGRIVETVIGAVVGVLVNVLFPPPVQSRFAGQSVARLAEEIAALLDEAATQLPAGPSSEQTARWLEDARRLNRHVPRVDRALTHAEESRRLNVRALGAPRSTRSLRGGLDSLELCSVATRTLFRSVHDWVRGGMPEPDERYIRQARGAWAELLAALAVVVRAFGQLLQVEAEGAPSSEAALLNTALDRLQRTRTRWDEILLADPMCTWPSGNSTPPWWPWWTGCCSPSTPPSTCACGRTGDGRRRCGGPPVWSERSARHAATQPRHSHRRTSRSRPTPLRTSSTSDRARAQVRPTPLLGDDCARAASAGGATTSTVPHGVPQAAVKCGTQGSAGASGATVIRRRACSR